MLSLCAEVLTSKVSSRRCKNAKGLVSGLQSALPGRKVGMAEMEYAGGLSPRPQSHSVRLPTKVFAHNSGKLTSRVGKLVLVVRKPFRPSPQRNCAISSSIKCGEYRAVAKPGMT